MCFEKRKSKKKMESEEKKDQAVVEKPPLPEQHRGPQQAKSLTLPSYTLTNITDLQEELRACEKSPVEKATSATVQDSSSSKIEPVEFEKDAKQVRIALGLEVREQSDYPTLSDVISDWGDSTKKGTGKTGGTSTTAEGSAYSRRTKKQFPRKPSPKRGQMPKEELVTQIFSTGQTYKVETENKLKEPIKKSEHAASSVVSDFVPCTVATGNSLPPPAAKSYLTIRSSRFRTSTSDRDSDDDEDAFSMVTVEPSETAFSSKGGRSVLQITNLSTQRLAFRVKSINSVDYKLRPDFGFVETQSVSQVEVEKSPGQVVDDTLQLCFKEASADVKNPMAVFTDNFYLFVATVKISAVTSEKFAHR